MLNQRSGLEAKEAGRDRRPAATDLRQSEDAILRPATVAKRLGVTRGTIYRWISLGDFPRPIRLGGGSVGWWASEVEDWVARRAAESRRTA